jgi:phosphoglycolate phosphatase
MVLKAIIFDFDGVIIDSFHYSKDIINTIFNDLSEKDFRDHHNGNVFEKPIIPFTETSALEFNEKYLGRVEMNNSFFKKEELKFLKEKYKLFIISSNRENVIEKFLKKKELEYFDEIFGELRHKSKVKKFEILFKKYNLNPDECIFITDTLGDIIESNKVNVKSIAVDFGFHEKERLEIGKPYRVVSNFDEIKEVIKNI